MKKKNLALNAAVLMFAAGLSGCSSVDKIVEEIDNKNYDAALEIISTENLSEKKQEKLSEEMLARVDAGVTAYAENSMSYGDISALISAAYKMDLPSLTPTLAAYSVQIEQLNSSKSNYEYGLASFTEKDYSSAYSYFGYVIEEDAYYEEALAKIDECVTKQCEKITGEVDKYISSNDYEEALNYLEQCKTSAFSNEITSVINDMTEKVRIKSTMAEAESYVSNGDISSALTLITDSINQYGIKDTTELDNYYNNVSADYVSMIMEKVEKLCEEENYISALNMLTNAQDVVYADEFIAAVERINEIKPTYLYDLKYSTSSRYEVIDTGESLMDTIGNTYTVGNLFQISAKSNSWSDDDNGSVEYYLGYNYNYLNGVISVSDTTEEGASATLKIMDGDVVLYTLDLTRTTTPTPICIDVSSVNWLKIVVVEPSGGTTYVILSDFYFSDESTQPVTEANDQKETDASAETETPDETEAPAENIDETESSES